MGEDDQPGDRVAECGFETLDQIVAALHGPAAGDEDVDGGEGSTSGLACAERVEAACVSPLSYSVA